jgi:N-acetylglucosaminyldiphosphoundecaprenol N-acetyl-beta-D-mannosaminyltransferase
MPSSNAPNRYNVLGVQLDPLTREEAARRIIERASHGGACYVTKPYVEFIDRAYRDPQVAELLGGGFMSLPDGVSLQWAATYLYHGRRSWWRALALAAGIVLRPKSITQPIPERFAGATFTWLLLETAEKQGKSVYLVGSPKSGAIQDTMQVIQTRLPKLELVGSWPGELGGLSGADFATALGSKPVETGLVADLRGKQPDIILVGMGFPLQERLMAKLTPQLSHGVLIGEGGTFDYDSFGGLRKRAPEPVRSIGLEWLWRLIQEPSRLKRQLAIPRFMWRVYRWGKQAKSYSQT